MGCRTGTIALALLAWQLIRHTDAEPFQPEVRPVRSPVETPAGLCYKMAGADDRQEPALT